MKYKYVLFDLYGTLVDLSTDEAKNELWKNLYLFYSYNGAKYEINEIKEAYLHEVKVELDKNTKTKHPDMRIQTAFYRLYKNKGVEASDELVEYTARLFRGLSTEYIKLYDNVKEGLKTLKDNGVKIYILSNAQRSFTVPEIKYLGIHDMFDGIYISSDIGICKPDVKFFEELANKEGIVKQETIMVGNDHRTDIEGANNFGVDSIYIHSNCSPNIEGVDIKSTHTILQYDFNKVVDICIGAYIEKA